MMNVVMDHSQLIVVELDLVTFKSVKSQSNMCISLHHQILSIVFLYVGYVFLNHMKFYIIFLVVKYKAILYSMLMYYVWFHIGS